MTAPLYRLALAATVTLGAACGSPEDPFTSGSAGAIVTGTVTDPGGSPIAGATINIACAGGGSAVLASTDTTGHYLANLQTGSDPFDGSSGSLLCHFREPAAASPRVEVDTLLGFARGPVLLALQLVDLHEP